ncbi:hypothetical protein EUGRSUZ_K02549 [Eucalyptus grandis]|uniref:D-aminoacyl-tRNA deacylase n=2 Tax=Eucalyptus grandis TaxID=71139 RepID=A0A059A5F8_EUCGR|nr:hypothetical protein EUGRSUZ_K02549 [Eucalyptus grandis]
MVTLVAATAADPASVRPMSSILAMPGWHPGPIVRDMLSFVNEKLRLLKLENHLVREDHLDKRWEEATGDSVDEVIFLSRHVAASNRPALTIHPIGTPHLREDEVPLAGGRPGWAAPPNPRIGPWLRLLKNLAKSHNLVPEFEVTLEATHHGPEISSPAMFVEIDDRPKVLLGIGGGYYVPWRMDNVRKDGIWVGHLLSGYSLPMEEPSESKEVNSKGVDGMWRKVINIAFETSRLAFPGGEVLAHLDLESFKTWRRKAVTEFLESEEIKIGKPGDFY